jgi:hypothetical protein
VNTYCCREVVSTNSGNGGAGARVAIGDPRPLTLAGRCRRIAGWIVPSGTLILLPKCPACLAAYFAIGTGIGISMSTAVYLRMALVTLCVTSLSYFAVRFAVSRGRRFIVLLAGSRDGRIHSSTYRMIDVSGTN